MYESEQSQAWRIGNSKQKSLLDLCKVALPFGESSDPVMGGSVSHSKRCRKHFLYTQTERRISSSSALYQIHPIFRADYDHGKLNFCRSRKIDDSHSAPPFNFEYQVNKRTKTVNFKPVVNPGVRKTLYCKGLFTTTHAKILRTISMALPSVILGCEARCTNRGWLGRLPDRDSGPGSIGIGLAPSSRAFLDKFKNLSTIVLSNVIPRLPVYEKRCFQVNSNCGHSLLIWFNRILKDFNNLHGQLRLRLNAFLKKLSMREYNHGHGGLFSIFNNHLTSTLNWRTCLGIM
jgi:hypothetical protein